MPADIFIFDEVLVVWFEVEFLCLDIFFDGPGRQKPNTFSVGSSVANIGATDFDQGAIDFEFFNFLNLGWGGEGREFFEIDFALSRSCDDEW